MLGYFGDSGFWIEYLQNIAPVIALVEAIAIVNAVRDDPKTPDDSLFSPLIASWRAVIPLVVVAMVIGAATIEATELMIYGYSFLEEPSAYNFAVNTISFSLGALIVVAIASRVDADRINWLLGGAAIVLGSLIAISQDFPELDILTFYQAVGLSSGGVILLATVNRASQWVLWQRLLYALGMNLLISLTIWHFVY